MSPAPDARTGTGLRARQAALAALAAVEDTGTWSNIAVPDAVAALPEARDRAFASHLAYDTLRWEGTLDWALGLVLTRPLADVEAPLRRVLRLGAVQLLRSGVPVPAAVSTSVALARAAVPQGRAKGAAGFVNGVLRNLARRLDDLPWPDADVDPVSHLSLTTAHPRWVVADLLGRFTFDETRAILEADNEPPGLTLRATSDRDGLLEELRAGGIDAAPTTTAPEGVRAPGADPRRLVAVSEGRATPQDEASMLVVRASRAASGDRVLDLCSGPGGKATHLAAVVGPEGRVTGIELHPHRARLVEETAARLGVEVDVRVGDATAPPLQGGERFDVVLLDGPCTGLGTGRRRPEVRWRRQPEDVPTLAKLQRRMLDVAVERTRPGGHLTFSVCTWTAGETTEVVADLLARAGDRLELVEERQLRPDTDDTDGMYLATFRRLEDPQPLPGPEGPDR
ncbi:MAG: methyltransferase domain-containing protein [Actinobacteria bacterium]|nr:methyltransferase domain-containing protein [Actinomycetota bacterium]